MFRRNTALHFGGGAVALIDADRTLRVRDSLFENNEALGRDGGAIAVTGEGHATRISGSTFHANRSLQDGGAISIGGASLNLENGTFVGNVANRNGGAIEISAPTATLASVSVTLNTSDYDDDGVGNGGGIVQQNSGSTIVVRNALIAGNDARGNAFEDCDGGFISDGYNLIGNRTGCGGFDPGINSDQVGTAMSPIDPLLLPLADNGGPMPTLSLDFGSLAIAGGNPMGCEDVDGAPLLFDQYGQPRPRPVGTACDIGAFELQFEGAIFSSRFEG